MDLFTAILIKTQVVRLTNFAVLYMTYDLGIAEITNLFNLLNRIRSPKLSIPRAFTRYYICPKFDLQVHGFCTGGATQRLLKCSLGRNVPLRLET